MSIRLKFTPKILRAKKIHIHTYIYIYISKRTQQIWNDAIVFHLHFIWYNFAWSRSFARYFLQCRAFATACINWTVWFYSVVQICDQTVREMSHKKRRGSVFWIKMLWIQVTAIQDTNSTENEDITYKLVSQSSCCWLVAGVPAVWTLFCVCSHSNELLYAFTVFSVTFCTLFLC